eukprot:SAG11_NODE_23186_length_393_cov_1.986395_1_plen_70_part_10
MRQSLLAPAEEDRSLRVAGRSTDAPPAGQSCWAAARGCRLADMLPPDFPRGECNTDFALVMLLSTLAIIP